MVFVQNKDGSPLRPCTEAKARHLIESRKAKEVKRTPFTIRLKFFVEDANTPEIIKALEVIKAREASGK